MIISLIYMNEIIYKRMLKRKEYLFAQCVMYKHNTERFEQTGR